MMRCVFALVVLFGPSAASFGQGQGQIKWPEVTQDQRDYSSNFAATNSAYVTGDINNGVFPSLEYPQTPPVTHVAYVRGSEVNVSVRWKNDNSFSLCGTLTWQAARLAVPNTSGGTDYIDLTVNSSPQSITLAANGGTSSKTLTLTSVPNYVAVGQIQVKYTLPLSDGETSRNNGTDGNFVGWERLALVDATPTGLQTVPWVDFLEYACRWAHGANDASTLRNKMVIGMHTGSRCATKMIYSPSPDPHYFFPYLGEGDANEADDALTIHLSSFLADMEESDPSRQCQDFAGILLLALQANGRTTTFDVVERWENGAYPGVFYTWKLCPAGTDRSNSSNYASYWFRFHAVVASDSYRQDSSASYLLDTSGATWKDPVWQWGVSAHWQNQVSSAFYGLAYGVDGGPGAGTNTQLPHRLLTSLQPTGVD